MATWAERTGFTKQELDNLYHKYRHIKGPENGFANLDEFIEWAASEKYKVGSRLERIDKNKPYSRENCRMVSVSPYEECQRRMITQWEKVMAPIRERYKAELDEIERKKPKTREFFRYEHPDLVREGIEWRRHK